MRQPPHSSVVVIPVPGTKTLAGQQVYYKYPGGCMRLAAETSGD